MLIRKNNLVVVPTALLSDTNISLSAKGLYAFLLTFPNEQEFSLQSIANHHNVFQIDIERWMEELIESSYIFIVEEKDGVLSYVIR